MRLFPPFWDYPLDHFAPSVTKRFTRPWARIAYVPDHVPWLDQIKDCDSHSATHPIEETRLGGLPDESDARLIHAD